MDSKWLLCCATAFVNGNYPPIGTYTHGVTVNTNSIIVFAGERQINLWPIIVQAIVTMRGSIYCKQRTDRQWRCG